MLFFDFEWLGRYGRQFQILLFEFLILK